MEGRETDVDAEVMRRNDDERNKVRFGGLGKTLQHSTEAGSDS